MPTAQPLSSKPDFEDAYKSAIALEKEVSSAEDERKNVSKKISAFRNIQKMTRNEIVNTIRKQNMQISPENYSRMMLEGNKLLKMDAGEKKDYMAKLSNEDKKMMIVALEWHKLMLQLDEETKQELARLELLERELFGDLEQAAEGAEPLSVQETIFDYSEDQALKLLQRPETRITNEDMKKAEILFKSQTPGIELSDEDKRLIAKVQEFHRLVSMLSEKNRTILAKEDIERERLLAKAEKEGWFDKALAEKIGSQPIVEENITNVA